MPDDLPSVLLLDLDDTIIDDSGNVDSSWSAVCEEAAAHAPIDPSQLKQHILEIRDWYWSDAARHKTGRADLRAASAWIATEALSRLGVNDANLGRWISERYRDLRLDTALMPGAVDAIAEFRRRGIGLALLTNGSAAGQRAKLDRFDLARHFDYICIEGEFGCGKPDEAVYLGALKALDAQPSDAWMVGDNYEWDVAAPMKLGIGGVWLDYFGTGLADGLAAPHRIIRSLKELF